MQAKKIWAMYWSATGTTRTVVTAVAGKMAGRLGLLLEEYDFTPVSYTHLTLPTICSV